LDNLPKNLDEIMKKKLSVRGAMRRLRKIEYNLGDINKFYYSQNKLSEVDFWQLIEDPRSALMSPYFLESFKEQDVEKKHYLLKFYFNFYNQIAHKIEDIAKKGDIKEANTPEQLGFQMSRQDFKKLRVIKGFLERCIDLARQNSSLLDKTVFNRLLNRLKEVEAGRTYFDASNITQVMMN